MKLTAVGVIASPRARLIKVTYDDGRQATIPLLRPNPGQERDAGLARFRYAAFAIPGPWSVERLVTQSAWEERFGKALRAVEEQASG